MKIKYYKTVKVEKELEIKDIKDCFFKYYNWYNCYAWIYKHSDYEVEGRNGLLQKSRYVYLEIRNKNIYYEYFNWLDCWTHSLESKIKNLLQYNEQVKEISKREFMRKKDLIINF